MGSGELDSGRLMGELLGWVGDESRLFWYLTPTTQSLAVTASRKNDGPPDSVIRFIYNLLWGFFKHSLLQVAWYGPLAQTKPRLSVPSVNESGLQ